MPAIVDAPDSPPSPSLPEQPRASRLVALCARRWNIPILAELARRDGAKFATLVHTLDAPPASVRASLDALIASGLVAPNPGYGHPLRPEYVLSDAGKPVASTCFRLDVVLSAAPIRAVSFRKWSIPVLDAVGRGCRRFGQIGGALPGITDRALSLSLRALEGVSMVDRSLGPGRPPTARYAIPASGQGVVAVLSDLFPVSGVR
ncbi:MAG: helix-turn-helix transcriptional regulator [Phycisphaerales bacterium]|nr:helix-turn-helix transcriptional regulator [Phycisphaerales bacterium]MCB9840437.1 helix-turn-helix transcriptional regulator [Phycisphaeraceae bacterium]